MFPRRQNFRRLALNREREANSTLRSPRHISPSAPPPRRPPLLWLAQVGLMSQSPSCPNWPTPTVSRISRQHPRCTAQQTSAESGRSPQQEAMGLAARNTSGSSAWDGPVFQVAHPLARGRRGKGGQRLKG